jgi:hypothetical protein
MIVVNMVSQNSSSPSIETSKTSIAFTIENTLNAHADCGYFTVATDKDEVQDLIGALLELRGQLRKLQWYGEVNRRGFIKITKKLDKKIETVCLQERYLTSKVNPRPFAHNLPLNQDMKAVNEWLSGLGDIKTFDDSGSAHSATSLGFWTPWTRRFAAIKLKSWASILLRHLPAMEWPVRRSNSSS